jgi:hypothetical protein
LRHKLRSERVGTFDDKAVGIGGGNARGKRGQKEDVF